MQWVADDGFEDPTRFDASVRHWATQIVTGWLTGKLAIKDHSRPRIPAELNNDADIGSLVAFFLAQPETYLCWTPYASYRGDGFSAGVWDVRYARVTKDFVQAIEHVCDLKAAVETARFRSLDEWLLADLNGTLKTSGALGGSQKIPEKVADRLRRASRDRRKRLAMVTPRVCICGAEFMPDRANAARCPTCRSNARAAGSQSTRSNPQ